MNIPDSNYFLIEDLSRAKFKTKDKEVILVENFRVLNILKNTYKYLRHHKKNEKLFKKITAGRYRKFE